MGVKSLRENKKSTQFNKELLTVGGSLGHLSVYWDPKLARVILNKRHKIHFFNSEKSSESLNQALKFIFKISGNICFVNSKEKFSSISKEAAFRSLQPALTDNWTNGLLTNSNLLQKEKISALFIINGKDDSFIIKESNKLNIPVISINDTDTNSHLISYPIFANDNSARIQHFISSIISDVIVEKSLFDFARNLKKDLQKKI